MSAAAPVTDPAPTTATPTPSPAPTTTVPTPSPTPTPAPAAKSWRDDLDADYRQEPTLARYESVGSLAKAFLEQRKLISQKGVIVPGADATPEAINEFYTALGRPESADKYDLGDWKAPTQGWDADFQTEAQQAFHAQGLTSKQVQGVLTWYAGKLQAEMGKAGEAEKATYARYGEELRKEFGTALDAKIDIADRAFRTLFPKEVQDVIYGLRMPDGGMLGENPAFVRAMAMAGEPMAEHRLLGDKEPTQFSKTPDEAKAELQKLKGDKEFTRVLFDRRDPGHAAANERWLTLHKQAGATPNAG